MQISPEHIQSGLARYTELRPSTCLACAYTGPMGVHSRRRKYGRAAIAGIALALIAPLLLLELAMRMQGTTGISIVWFLIAGAVAYGLSLVEDVVLACPNCSAGIEL